VRRDERSNRRRQVIRQLSAFEDLPLQKLAGCESPELPDFEVPIVQVSTSLAQLALLVLELCPLRVDDAKRFLLRLPDNV
jgi:hypothetical protein